MQINARHAHSAKLPRGLKRCQLEPEASAMIQTEAIEVFTAMVNSGRSPFFFSRSPTVTRFT